MKKRGRQRRADGRQPPQRRKGPTSLAALRPPPPAPAVDEPARVEPQPSFETTVVGVGASAGGLEAFSALLHALPPDPEIAIVLVQHLAPQHESVLAELLGAQTPLPVLQAAEGMRVEKNHVYVIPPNTQMVIAPDGKLHLSPRPATRARHCPIDFFLGSLAEAMQDRAIGVILSGTASDGTSGIREVKAVGGIAFAQDPETAKCDGMPRAAIATGLVDVVLPPKQIAAELARLGRHEANHALPEVPRGSREHDVALERIFSLLRVGTGVDFRRYKLPTVERRVRRRMVLHHADRLQDYARLLETRPDEVRALYHDFLINVTHFFREPHTFEALRDEILPRLLEDRAFDQPLRAWVAGCATGEEAYSLAIVVLEALGERSRSMPVQIFATDLSDPAIERARAGFYPKSIESDVSAERLKRFFTRSDGGYRVSKHVREVCAFAHQDLTRDPPFSRLDLILCRNVLIYFGPELQKRVMGLFHYALKPSGYLVLGRAETIGSFGALFAQTDKRARIYQKKDDGGAAVAPAEFRMPREPELRGAPARGDGTRRVQQEANRIVQEQYAPPGVLVDSDHQIVQFRGDTGAYLAPPPGEPTLDVLKMAREGLLHALRGALHEARRGTGVVRRDGLRVKADGGSRKIGIEVVPLLAPETPPHFLILFREQTTGHAGGSRVVRKASRAAKPDSALAQLQQELNSSREYMRSIIQELEAANEELQSANEEILSSNEELQSTNEELDTAKEELQSTNEEINTVNEELQARNDELSRVNADVVNLLASVQIAIVIVAADFRIRRFTPMAERVLNLLPADVGRPIGHIKPNIDCPDLEELVADVTETLTVREREVRDRQGNTYSLRIRPYKNLENRIDGVVLSLFDVTALKRQEVEVSRVRDLVEGILDSTRRPMALLDSGLHVRLANRAFCDAMAVDSQEVRGRPIAELSSRQVDASELRALAQKVLEGAAAVDERLMEDGSPTSPPMQVSARRIEAGPDREAHVVLALEVMHATTRGTTR